MPLPACPFERAILSTEFSCHSSQRQYIAEKEAVACMVPAALQQCKELIRHFRQCASFALPALKKDAQLPHGQEMKLKAGGLNGICSLLELEDAVPSDIRACVDSLLLRYQHFEAVPCEPVVRSIQAYRGRRRLKPR